MLPARAGVGAGRVEVSQGMRAFVAVEPPEPVREEAAAVARDLAARLPGLRPVRAASIHLTLRFLGEVSTPIEALAARLGAALAGLPAATIAIRGAGAFPDAARPRVVWLGADGGPALLEMGRRVREADLEGCGREEDEFRPHLTIGRFRRPPRGGLAGELGRLAGSEIGRFTAREVVLFESRLEPAGARHLARARLSLGGA